MSKNCVVAVFAAVSAAATAHGPTRMAPAPEPAPRRTPRYGELPLHFEANQGQTDRDVKFLARGSGYGLFLTPTESVLVLHKPNAGSPAVVRMKLVGANPRPVVAGRDELPGKSNYFIGNDPSRWRTNVPQYARVEYQDVYPGVNLAYYGNQRQLEYDFVVSPGGDPRRIRFGIEGAEKIQVDAEGNLVLSLPGADVVEKAPVVYQEFGGVRKAVDGRFVMRGRDEVGFEVGAYEVDRPLVLDPLLAYSTCLGGSGEDWGWGIAVDATGNTYVAGHTSSIDFPTAAPMQSANAGGNDAIVVKLSSSGSLVYSTFLGGSGNDTAFSIAVSTSGSPYITGQTSSVDFPTANPVQAGNGGGDADAFVAQLSATGSALLYSTYLGGSGHDDGRGIAVDPSGNSHITGLTESSNFPTVNPIQPTNAGGYEAFVAKLNASGSALVYSTYLGGNGLDIPYGIAADTSGNAYVTGQTVSTNFPTANPFQGVPAGGGDAFVTKLNSTGSSFIFSTYLGGSLGEAGGRIAVDSSRNAYVLGQTESTDFPMVNPVQPTNKGGEDMFVAKLDSPGSTLAFSTYLGGAGWDAGAGIAVEPSGSAYITGFTASGDFPMAMPLQPFGGGTFDAFVVKLSTAPSALIYSTYLGGSGLDYGHGIAVDSSGTAHVVGVTTSTNFPTNNPIQSAHAGGIYDVFVARISSGSSLADLSITKSDGLAIAGAGSPVTYTIVVSNAGPAAVNGATVADTFPPALAGVTWLCTASAGSSCGAASGSGNLDTTVTLLTGGDATFTATGRLDVNATGTLSNTATVAAPADIYDPYPANNTSTDTDTIIPAADLSITKDDGRTHASPGDVITYTIVATNAGPTGMVDATVWDYVPASLTSVTWTCVGTGGGTCSASGSGDINDPVNVPVGATLTYTLVGTVTANPASLSNTAGITPAVVMSDPNTFNNAATDSDTLTCFNETVVVPDGRLTQATIASGATAWFAASVRSAKTYSVEFRNLTGTAPPGTLTWFSGDDGCSGVSTLATTDTSSIDPAGTNGIARVSFTAAGAQTFYRARLENTAGAPVTVSVRWSDTTMFSPAWSTNGSFDTFYSIQNTTGTTLDGTLRFLDPSGTVLSALAVTAPAGQTVSTNTAALGVLRNRIGTALFIHNGPPGSFVVEAAIANFTISPAYVQPVKFQPVREAR